MIKKLNQSHGLAVGAILLAIILLVALAAAIAIAVRSSHGQGGTASENYTNAISVMAQAQNFQQTIDQMLAQGIDISLINYGSGNWLYNFANPSNGGHNQYRPPNAVMYTPDNWHYRNINTYMEGAGTGAGADYVLFLVDVRPGVCAQINQILYHNPAIPAPDPSVPNTDLWSWFVTPFVTIDYTGDPAHSTLNRPEGCIYAVNIGSASSPHAPSPSYIFYKITYVQ